MLVVTIGHEFSGTVKEVGKGVTGFEVGQNVVVQPTIYCESCGACKDGVENACAKGGFIGLSGGGGGMSEEVVAPARAVMALPKGIDLDIGMLSSHDCLTDRLIDIFLQEHWWSP